MYEFVDGDLLLLIWHWFLVSLTSHNFILDGKEITIIWSQSVLVSFQTWVRAYSNHISLPNTYSILFPYTYRESIFSYIYVKPIFLATFWSGLLNSIKSLNEVSDTFLVFVFVRSPLVSFLYERGWRQNFNRSGFPGPDEEVQSCFIHLLNQANENN